jgi:hypothetical protein
MGLQSVLDVDLIRHAYVLPSNQGGGIGDGLLRYLGQSSKRRTLVGTWDAAVWAIRFYRRHGFELVSPAPRQCFSRPIRARRIDGSTLRWCSPIRRTTARREFARG